MSRGNFCKGSDLVRCLYIFKSIGDVPSFVDQYMDQIFANRNQKTSKISL